MLTTLLDVDASVIGILYRHRWQIELFFRWMKSYARFDHLISHTREGVLLNFYVAVIGVTLMYLHMGHRPSKYLFIMLGMVANGSASLEEIMPILRERERQCQMQRDRVAQEACRKTQVSDPGQSARCGRGRAAAWHARSSSIGQGATSIEAELRRCRESGH